MHLFLVFTAISLLQIAFWEPSFRSPNARFGFSSTPMRSRNVRLYVIHDSTVTVCRVDNRWESIVGNNVKARLNKFEQIVLWCYFSA